ncbi:SDR family oxidoreductase [Nostoc sp. FACHB-888]|uniref:SDR family oxidoreductase n=1 Tax=Nostoc sp. FACHB-888 TaxID=2692842 RepID=UPI0016850E51|nr:SDR family oxidoreductase [Nostoc sp. FACHB-888]MBD2248274.1 SDR family oxidoreductase [Nostoc sp. FACHB-888]
MTTLSGKVALVTGGTSGIGKATAIALAQAGAKVVVAGRRQAEGEETIREIQTVGGEGFFVTTDISQETDVQTLIEKVIANYGRLDIAFNNAGVEQDPTPLTEQTEATYDRIMDINVKGVWLSLKHEIPAMLKNGGGAIVNTSSIMGLVGGATVPIYNASKHAVEGLTKSVALEYAKSGIRVNAVSPGPIQTVMFDRFAEANPQAGEYFKTATPMGRIGQVEEVVNAVLWLASEAASYITGQSLTIDGGYVAQ